MDGIEQIKKHEGLELKVYTCTAGRLTIGYGRNLEDRGITEEEALYLLRNDIEKITKRLKKEIKFFDTLNEPRQWVLINMAYNMGVTGLLKFKNTLKNIENEKYIEASNQMLDSKWAKQVKGRAQELAAQMAGGSFIG